MHRIDLKMLIFGFYSNICYHERQLKLMDINHNVEGLVENMSQSESSKNYSESIKQEEEYEDLPNLEVPTPGGDLSEEFKMNQAFSPKKTKEEKRFFMLKEKMMKKYWIKKLARETYKLLPNTEDSNLVKRSPNTHKIKLVENK